MTVTCFGEHNPHDSDVFLFPELLEGGDNPHESNATREAKTLYKSCMNMSELYNVPVCL